MEIPTLRLDVDYERLGQTAKDFISDFKDATGTHKYLSILQKIADRETDQVVIELDDMEQYEKNRMEDLGLLKEIQKNTTHMVELFSTVIDGLLPEPTRDLQVDDEIIDVLIRQRREMNEFMRDTNMNEVGDTQDTSTAANTEDLKFPPQLMRRYTLYFKPPSGADGGKTLAVRQVRGKHLGHMIKVRGIVTRVSDVQPAVEVTAYVCDVCGNEIFQEVKAKQFMPLVYCPSEQCVTNQVKSELIMATRASKFVPFQEVRIQELAEQVPVGHVPRSLVVHVSGPLVRTVSPGDGVDISGIFMPSPYTGFQALKAGLLTETYLLAQDIMQHKQVYSSIDLTQEMRDRIQELSREGNVYERLASSIAPEIYGHLDVKKALLLLLIGGVTKQTKDGMKIRGDINVCLMGDPGVAKSQLLKFVSRVAPRGVYTTGRGSSGVGLTAAVLRDASTDELVLEGGALVLADEGVCCIDEFDKMDDTDRTAIHEVMEQQTISISKAGISTTLNARTSILAAANPLYGRYNPKVSPVDNINLPAALLSRFDILFLILDKPSRAQDERLASYVTQVHMNSKPPMAIEPLDEQIIRQYIALARRYRPVLTKEVADMAVSAYVQMRQRQVTGDAKDQFTHATPRALLGLVRMAQALARLRFDNQVTRGDVDEALRLLDACHRSLNDDGEGNNFEMDTTPTSQIYHIIRSLFLADGYATQTSLPVDHLRERVRMAGYSDDKFEECIREYSDLGIWQLTDGGATLDFIDQ